MSITKSKTQKTLAVIMALVMAFTSIWVMSSTSGVSAAEKTCGYDTGATKIFEGMATDDKDITIYNDKITASFAVGSNNYWNMTKGSILDIGIRGAGGTADDYGVDLVNDVELLADLWTSTGTYKGTDLRDAVTVTPEVSADGNTVTVTSKYQYWVADPNKDKKNEDALPLDITQVYTLKAGNNYITMETTVKNPNTDIDYRDMYTGYSISTNAANMFGPYGFYPDVKTTGIAVGDNEKVQEKFGDFVTTYSDDYAVTLQMDGTDAYKGSTGYKDIYQHRDLKAGQTYTFTGEVLVADGNETATVMDRFIDREKIAKEDYVTVEGTITDKSGKPVEGASIIAQKTGVYMQTAKSVEYTSGHVDGTVVSNMQPFLWYTTGKDGKYSFRLPKTGYDDKTANIQGNGDYTYQFKIEAPGYTSKTSEVMSLTSDKVQDYTIETGAEISLTAVDQKGQKIPFRVEISGVTTEIKTAGASTYYSNALNKQDPHTVTFNLSQADNVTFTASYGKDFESLAESYTTNVTAAGVKHEFVIDEAVDPEAEQWYAVDNHQHSDYGDGATTIEDLFSAQIAAKLDMCLVADHDSRANVYTMSEYAKATGIPFLPNMEVSPGWGHWGVLGVAYNATDKGPIVDATQATPQDIIKAGHDAGAIVIVHHPYSDYGFLNNQASVNGGLAKGWDDFDLLELQSTMDLSEMEALSAKDYSNISFDNLNKTIQDAGISNMDAKALVTAMHFWNQGTKKYLSAGSDQHQASSTTLYPGIIREYAQLEEYTVENYMAALKKGHGYVTMGPLFFPSQDNMFGETIKAQSGKETTIKLDAQAVNGMDKVMLYSNGVLTAIKELKGSTKREAVNFTVKPAKDTKWYSIVALDSKGNYAASNPIWTDVAAESGALSLNTAAKTLAYGKSFTLKASGDVTWKSSDKKVATVSKYGKVTAKGVGKATITATAANGEKATCKVTVTKASQALKVSTATKTVKYAKVRKANTNTSKVAVSGNKGKVTYSKISGSSKLKINAKTGKIAVKKGTKKGTYKIKVKVKAAASANYKAASKNATVSVKVK